MYPHRNNHEVGMNEWYSDWLQHRGDVATSLADTLEQAIRSGRLAPGAQLPTHRDLSKRLGVAVSTVSRAYAEAARRGLIGGDVPADDVYAVSGGQTALMTIFLALARPGDTVLTEELTWPGALSVGRLTGIRLMPVAIDDEGLVPHAFEAACQAYRPRFVYTMPTLHNPTTVTASLDRRKEIVRIARTHNVLIVEDDAYGFLVEPRATPYCQLARDITVYLTSMSKSIAPALRVGFMAVPPRLHKALRAAMRATTTMVSPILLELTSELINSGAGRETARMQTDAARQRQRLAASILGQDGSAPTSL